MAWRAEVKRIDPGAVTKGRQVGYGSYATVFEGFWGERPVALKVFKEVRDYGVFISELGATACLKDHPNVVKVYGITMVDGMKTIVMEYCENGSLFTALHELAVDFSDSVKHGYLLQIALGMVHLHTAIPFNVVHRDLKSANLLLCNESATIKITDFGLAKTKKVCEETNLQSLAGTVFWTAPEVLDRSESKPYSSKCDVYSFGIVLWELLAEKLPYNGGKDTDYLRKIMVEHEVPSPEEINIEYREIYLDCVALDPIQRPSFMEIYSDLMRIGTKLGFLR